MKRLNVIASVLKFLINMIINVFIIGFRAPVIQVL